MKEAARKVGKLNLNKLWFKKLIFLIKYVMQAEVNCNTRAVELRKILDHLEAFCQGGLAYLLRL